MSESTYPHRSEEVIARENALRDPTPVINLPGYPETYWDATEPCMKSYPGSVDPTRKADSPPMAESLRIRRELTSPLLTWLVATLAGVALGATAWLIAAG